MKLTTENLMQLIREEIENVAEAMAFKKTGVEKFENPDTGETIEVNHETKRIHAKDKDGQTTKGIVYDQKFSPPSGFKRVGEDKFNKAPKNLGVS